MNRDDGLRRIRTVTGWTLAGTVGAAGVFAGLAAHAHPGATTSTKKSSASTATTTTPATSAGSQSSDSQSSQSDDSQIQGTTVGGTTSSNTPTVVSGAS